MLKYLTMFAMLVSLNNVSYVEVSSIEYYQQKSDVKQIIFNFKSDYFSTHTIEVIMEFYDLNDNFIKGYKSELSFTGDKEAIANIKYDYSSDSYALIDINYNDSNLVRNAKINFYVQDDCLIDIDNRECRGIYKSYYEKGISKDEMLKFIVNESNFYKYLSDNRLKVENITFYSNYGFDNAIVHLYLNNKIDGYNLVYDDSYSFLLSFNENNKLELMDTYFVNILDFEFSENYNEGTTKVKEIHFPYSSDYKEYELSLLIEDFINIRIEFNIFTKGDLLGECSTSKYCLAHESN